MFSTSKRPPPPRRRDGVLFEAFKDDTSIHGFRSYGTSKGTLTTCSKNIRFSCNLHTVLYLTVVFVISFNASHELE